MKRNLYFVTCALMISAHTVLAMSDDASDHAYVQLVTVQVSAPSSARVRGRAKSLENIPTHVSCASTLDSGEADRKTLSALSRNYRKLVRKRDGYAQDIAQAEFWRSTFTVLTAFGGWFACQSLATYQNQDDLMPMLMWPLVTIGNGVGWRGRGEKIQLLRSAIDIANCNIGVQEGIFLRIAEKIRNERAQEHVKKLCAQSNTRPIKYPPVDQWQIDRVRTVRSQDEVLRRRFRALHDALKAQSGAQHESKEVKNA